MSDRVEAARVITSLHAARIAGDLAAVCGHFAAHGRFEILGASAVNPVSIRADGLESFRPWLSMMVKVFRLSNYSLQSLIVEGSAFAANWRVDIHSKVTGITVRTELVDLVELGEGRIVAYKEFFAPC